MVYFVSSLCVVMELDASPCTTPHRDKIRKFHHITNKGFFRRLLIHMEINSCKWSRYNRMPGRMRGRLIAHLSLFSYRQVIWKSLEKQKLIEWLGTVFWRGENSKGVWRYWEWGGLNADRGKGYIWGWGLAVYVEMITAIGPQRRDGPA